MKCSNCGFESNSDSKFCPKCGTPTQSIIQNNNIDPDATVAVNTGYFKTQSTNQPSEPVPTIEPVAAEDDLNATVALNNAAFTTVPQAAEEITPPVYDNNMQSDDLDGTVRLEPNNPTPPPAIPPQNSKPPKNDKKKNKTLIIILSVVGAIIVIAGILVALMLTDVIPNIFEKDEKKTEQKQDDEEETDESTDTDTTEPSVETDEPSSETEEPAPETTDTEYIPDTSPATEPADPVPDAPTEAVLSESILKGSWEGSIDIGEYFEGLAEGIELPSLPVNGTYTFDGNGNLTRTLDTQQLSTMLSLLAESNDSSIIALLAYTASAFDGDKTFSYTIQNDQVVVDNGRSVLTYTADGTLTGILAGCTLELEK